MILYFGLIIDIIFCFLITWWWRKRIPVVGTIVVVKMGEKLTYSLEVDGDPQDLQYKKKVIFHVKVPEESHRK